MLILFQFVSVKLVLGFYEKPVPQSLTQIERALTQVNEVKKGAEQAIGLPVRLKIPSLRVNAIINPVGLTSNGAMDVPKLPRDTAWYKLGPKPGEKGSAVIAGHLDWLYGATGAFQNLKKLKPGDLITVEDENGVISSFVVRKSRTYGWKDDASEVFHSSDGKMHLNLVTCAGIWDRITKIYTKRLVVFADKVVE